CSSRHDRRYSRSRRAVGQTREEPGRSRGGETDRRLRFKDPRRRHDRRTFHRPVISRIEEFELIWKLPPSEFLSGPEKPGNNERSRLRPSRRNRSIRKTQTAPPLFPVVAPFTFPEQEL